jgi:iron(II)-dependent oxidoreductase
LRYIKNQTLRWQGGCAASIPNLMNMRAAPLNAREIIGAMREFRARTLALVADLDDRQMIGPRLSTVNPPLWEIGHVAWFQEFWVLRNLKKRRPLMENGDRLYNSTDVAHDSRWELLLPARRETLRYLETVLDGCLELIDAAREIPQEELYFYLLAMFHEGMHAEALAYTRQTLAYPPAKLGGQIPCRPYAAVACSGDVEIPGGTFAIGATADFPFVFDNEKWAHKVTIKPFRISRTPVTNGEFLAFVEAGGYHQERFWSPEGWGWLETGGAPQLERSLAQFFNEPRPREPHHSESKEKLSHPVYWRRTDGGRWQQRVYDQFVALRVDLPVVHLSWYEAQAYCQWAGRRLPKEAEWEVAAAVPAAGQDKPRDKPIDERRLFPWGDAAPSAERANLDWRAGGLVEVGAYPDGDSALGCRQMIGNVWEWTADDFLPYPGFTVDPYKEYSKPWFGTHKVLRGGCWATSLLLIRNTWRNFYTPDRRDVWAGFRTCATR